MRNSSQQIVHYDAVINRIVSNHPDGAIELLMREYTLANDRDSLVAALIGALVMSKVCAALGAPSAHTELLA